MKVTEVTPTQLDATVEIAGRIVSVRDFSKGCKYVVQDDSGKIPVILWADVLAETVGRECLRAGAGVSVRGRVSDYKGELRIVPGHGADVKLLAPVEDQTRASTLLGDLPRVGAGQSVWVIGVITSMELFSKGVKLHISDGSGEAIVLLWQNVYDVLPDKASLTLDARIGVFGEVNHYRSEWEIAPPSWTEVSVLEEAP
jgi:hypothetical protein